MMFARFTLVLILVGIVDFTSVRGQIPAREICKDLLPHILPIPTPPPGVEKSDTSWIIVRTTKMKDPRPPDFDENVNTCTPRSYGPKCDGIQFLREPENDGNGFTAHMFAKHKTDEYYLHSESYFKSEDLVYQIYSEEIKKMEFVVDEKQLPTPVTTIPDFVKTEPGQIIAVVDMPADGRWLILSTCDKTFAMVVLNWQYPVTDSPQAIWSRSENKINAKLTSLGINPSTMETLPLDSFEFKMYAFVNGKRGANVGETTNTSGGAGTSADAEIQIVGSSTSTSDENDAPGIDDIIAETSSSRKLDRKLEE